MNLKRLYKILAVLIVISVIVNVRRVLVEDTAIEELVAKSSKELSEIKKKRITRIKVKSVTKAAPSNAIKITGKDLALLKPYDELVAPLHFQTLEGKIKFYIEKSKIVRANLSLEALKLRNEFGGDRNFDSYAPPVLSRIEATLQPDSIFSIPKEVEIGSNLLSEPVIFRGKARCYLTINKKHQRNVPITELVVTYFDGQQISGDINAYSNTGATPLEKNAIHIFQQGEQPAISLQMGLKNIELTKPS